jgi:hypothetical protein
MNNKPEINVERAIDEAAAYANAARLTVEVYYPENWGRSPQFGPLGSGMMSRRFSIIPGTIPFSPHFTLNSNSFVIVQNFNNTGQQIQHTPVFPNISFCRGTANGFFQTIGNIAAWRLVVHTLYQLPYSVHFFSRRFAVKRRFFSCLCRGKGKYGPSNGNLGGNLNRQPMVSRYFYNLFYNHNISIITHKGNFAND